MKKIFLINIFALVLGALNLSAQCTIQIVTSDISDETCVGSSDASATATAAGVGQITYLWSDGQTTGTATGLTAGTYTVTATDANTCTGVASVDIIVNPEGVWIMTSSTPVTCNGGSDGTAYAGVMTGQAPYTYLWDDPNAQTTVTATGLTAGQYHVSVTDVNGCSNVAPVTVDEPTAVVIVSNSTNETCFGDADGTASASASGGTGQITYLWSDGQTTGTATGLTAGTYTVTATDANGCPSVESVIVNLTNPQIIVSGVPTPVSCNGGNDGTATVSVSAGNGPFSYAWNNGQTTEMATGLSAGTYTCIVTGADGCTGSTTVTVTEPDQLMISIAPSNISCNGANDGSATASSNGGTGQVTYSWSNGASGPTVSNLSPGTYTCIGTDANGCTNEATVTISEPSLLTATGSGTDVTSVGGNDGTASANPSGGTPGYTYSWNNGGTTQTITGLTAGTYTCTITDTNGCTTTITVIVNQPIELMISSTPSTCGANDGTATVVATGGIPPFTYLWNDGQTTATATGLAGGTYTVTVTDSAGNMESTSVVVSESSTITADASHSNETCVGSSDGHVAVSTSGGVGQMSFLWSNGATTSQVNNLGVGTYTVTVTDEVGCTATASATIVLSPEGIWVDITTTDVSCGGNDGSATAIVTTGVAPYTYAWSNGGNTATISNLTVGDYTVTVTDVNGCEGIFSTTINSSNVSTIVATASHSNETCVGSSDGHVAVSTSGGVGQMSFLWSNGATTDVVNNLGVGTYTVTVTDEVGCTATASATIELSPEGIWVDITTMHVSCFGGNDGKATAVVTTGVSPYTYAWSNGGNSEMISNLTAGVYTVSVTDQNNCVGIFTTTVTEPTELIATTSSTDVLCNATNGTATVSATGGTTNYTYMWSTGSSDKDLSGLGVGTYTATVTDANGCTSVSSTTISNINTVIITTANTTNPSAQGASDGSIDIDVSGGNPGYSYIWSNGSTSQDIFNLIAGCYTVTVTDMAGCTATKEECIEPPCEMMINVTTVNNDCTINQGSAEVNITETCGNTTYTYNWTNDQGDPAGTTQTITGLINGTYFVTVTGGNGLTASGSGVVTGSGGITSTATWTNIKCNGETNGTAMANGMGGVPGYTYMWSNGAMTQSIDGLSVGTYTVTVTDQENCTSTSQVEITEPTELVITSLTPTDDASFIAMNGSITVTASGGTPGYTYLWSTGSTGQTITGLSIGCYTVTVTDMNMCTAEEDICIPNCSLTATAGSTDVSCFGGNDGSATVTPSGGSGNYTYAWSNGGTTAMISNLTAGTYTATVTDTDTGCTAEASTMVNQPSQIIPSFSVVNPTTMGGSDGSIDLTVTGGTPTYTYLWDPNGETTEDLSMLSAGCYTVTITDMNMCTAVADTCLIDIPPPCTITLVMDSTDVSCFGENDGDATVTASGGSGSYNYSWSNGASTAMISNLTAGTYTVTVTDQNDPNCMAVGMVTVNQPTQIIPSFTVVNPTTMGGSDGSIDLTVTGGTPTYTYVWDPNGETTEDLSMLSAGCYTVTITDMNMCTAVADTCLIDIPPPPCTITLTIDSTNVSCFGGNDGDATVNATGGSGMYTYEWDPNGETTAMISNLTAGTYTVTVTDQMDTSCFAVTMVTITEPTELVASGVGMNPSVAGASDGSIDLTVTGGTPSYTYLWSNGETTEDISMLSAGCYTVTVTDSNNCMDTTTVCLTDPPMFDLVSLPDTCSTTDDGEACVIVTSGWTEHLQYEWKDDMGAPLGTANDSTILNLPAGTYYVTVTDTLSTPPTVVHMEAIEVTEYNNSDIFTTDFTIEFDPCLEDSTVVVFTDITTVTNTVVDKWEWYLSDQPIPPTLNPFSVAQKDSLTFYEAGTYDVTLIVQAELGCTDTLTKSFTIDSFVVSLPDTIPLCLGDTTFLNPTPNANYSYEWSQGIGNVLNPEVNPTQTTVYSVTVTNPFGTVPCMTETEVVVFVPPTMDDFMAMPETAVVCKDSSVVLTASSTLAQSYSWHNASPPSTGNMVWDMADYPRDFTMADAPQFYYVVATDAYGCTAVDSVMAGNAAIEVLVPNSQIVCKDDQFTFNPDALVTNGNLDSLQYTWFNSNLDTVGSDPTLTVTVTETTSYTLLVEGEYGCSIQDEFGVESFDLQTQVEALADPDTILRSETSNLMANFPDGFGQYTFNWDNAGTLSGGSGMTPETSRDPIASPSVTTMYTVNIMEDSLGCSATANVLITVIDICDEPYVFIPNAFSPNDDGENDVLYVRSVLAQKIYLIIYNRWGEKVFESRNINDGWDGTHNGEPVCSDVYGFYLEVECSPEDEPYIKKGNITVLK